MKEQWNRYRELALQYWRRLTKMQRFAVVGSAIFLAATVVLVAVTFSRTEYAVAFQNLRPETAASIKEYLEKNGIPYKMSADGTSIGVPADRVAEVRVDVAAQGLLKSGSLGYGMFRNTGSFGMTDKEFNVQFLAAVQGELEQMINSIEGVASSKVMVTLPKDSPFLSVEPQETQAAVVVTLKPGVTLSQQQIDTMYLLVEKSLPKLKRENITISNQYGELYTPSQGSSDGSTNVVGKANEQLQIKKNFEADIQRKIISFLGPLLGGTHKVVPLVYATLNFDAVKEIRNMVTPVNTADQTGIDISIQEIQKSYSSEGGAEGGVAGTGETDVPGYPATGGSGRVNSEELNRIVNREVNRIQQEVMRQPYVVKDLTISVGIEPPDPNNPDSLTPELRDAIQRLLVSFVSAALVDSGQTFTPEQLAEKVTVIPHAITPPATAAASRPNWLYVLYGVGALALLLGAGGALWAVRRRKSAAEAEEQAAALVEEPAKKIEPLPVDLESATTEAQIRRQLEQLARRKPTEFVNLLRTWLVEE